MVKTLTVSIDNWIMDEIVDNGKPEGIGKSEWTRNLLTIGWEEYRKKQVALGSPETASERNADVAQLVRAALGVLPVEDKEIDSMSVPSIYWSKSNWKQWTGGVL